MKNKKILLLFAAFLLLILAACSDKKTDTTPPQDKNDETDETSDSVTNLTDDDGGTLNTGDGYGFNKFDLEIEVDGKDAVDVEYKAKENPEYKYKNELTGVELKDDEAIDELDKLFVKLMLTKDTSGEEARDEILEWFGIRDYSKFDLEVEFDDGHELDYEDKK